MNRSQELIKLATGNRVCIREDIKTLKDVLKGKGPEEWMQKHYSDNGPDKHDQDDYNGSNYVQMNFEFLVDWSEYYDEENGTNFNDIIWDLHDKGSSELAGLLPNFGIMGWEKKDFDYWIKK